MYFHPFYQFRKRDRSAVEISLKTGTAQLQQFIPLRFSFHIFGDCFKVQCLAKFRDSRDDVFIPVVFQDIARYLFA